MTIVVGLAPGERGVSAVRLGAMLARSAADNLVVATVVPTPWPPNPYRADAEYLAYQEKAADEALELAQSQVGDDVAVEFLVHQARSVSSGLLEVARDHDASLVALGSSDSGLLGLVSIGGVAQRVLHSSEVPVTLAPQGFGAAVNARVSRITVGFGRGDHDSDLLVTAASVAQRIDAALRVACFAVRPLTSATGAIEPSADDLVVGEWVHQLDRDIDRALRSTAGAEGAVATTTPIVLGQGGSWAEAMADVDWESDTEVLAIGTTSSSVSRYFLGSHAAKIVRNATVPVFLMPRAVPLP